MRKSGSLGQFPESPSNSEKQIRCFRQGHWELYAYNKQGSTYIEDEYQMPVPVDKRAGGYTFPNTGIARRRLANEVGEVRLGAGTRCSSGVLAGELQASVECTGVTRESDHLTFPEYTQSQWLWLTDGIERAARASNPSEPMSKDHRPRACCTKRDHSVRIHPEGWGGDRRGGMVRVLGN